MTTKPRDALPDLRAGQHRGRPEGIVADHPLRFAAELLEHRGALVEPASDHIQILLPPDLQSRLGWKEDSILVSPSTGTNASDRVDAAVMTIGYGMAPLDQLLDLARDEASLCALQMPLGYPSRRDLASQSKRTYLFHTKVRLRFEEGLAAPAVYLLVHYVLSATSEETHEETISVVVNAETLAPISLLLPVVLGTSINPAGVRFGPDPTPSAPSSGWKAPYVAAGREASRVAAERIQTLARAMDRRRQRDRDRLRAYFEGLAAETRARSKGRGLGEEEIRQRLGSIQRELERKVADLELRYALKAVLRPVAVAVIRAPAVQAAYQAQWKTKTRELPVRWSPLTGTFEPMACDICGSGGFEFSIAEDLRAACCSCG